MQDHGDRRVDRVASRVFACLAALALAGCGAMSDPAGFSIVSQDRYDFLPCRDILAQHNIQSYRLKQLSDGIEKAEASPGGFIVGAAAYRSEYVHVRALVAAAERAARKNNCELPKPK
jgi:hypothetical protein